LFDFTQDVIQHSTKNIVFISKPRFFTILVRVYIVTMSMTVCFYICIANVARVGLGQHSQLSDLTMRVCLCVCVCVCRWMRVQAVTAGGVIDLQSNGSNRYWLEDAPCFPL